MEKYTSKHHLKSVPVSNQTQISTPRNGSNVPNSALSILDADSTKPSGSDLKSAIISRFSFSSDPKSSSPTVPPAPKQIQLPSSILQKAETRYHVSLAGMETFEDEGLLDSGFSGYARGHEIHIDCGLEPHEREEVILHEAGHVVQRGSSMANGSGFLDSPKLEGLADSGFVAPSNFHMPSDTTGPVMGNRRGKKKANGGRRKTKQPPRVDSDAQPTAPPLEPQATAVVPVPPPETTRPKQLETSDGILIQSISIHGQKRLKDRCITDAELSLALSTPAQQSRKPNCSYYETDDIRVVVDRTTGKLVTAMRRGTETMKTA